MRCGPRLLIHIAKKHLGISLDDDRADALCLLDQDGTSPEGMKRGMEDAGFKKVGVLEGISLDDLGTIIGRGAIVTLCYIDGGIDNGHWVELIHVDSELCGLWDSDTGYRAVPKRWLDVMWLDYTVKDGKWILHDRTSVVGFKR
jgi:predicted double-glycine peptidase